MTTKEYQDRFEKVARICIKRDGLEELLSSIAKTDFYTAPASTRFHHSEEHGLVEHSIDVFNKYGATTESEAIVTLFHDVCKIGYYKPDTRNVKVNGRWETVPYYSVDDKFPIGHGEKSVIMIMQHMKLTDDEIMAIRWHMGGYEPSQNYNYMSDAYNQCPLAVLLHCADLKSTYLK